MGRKVHGRRHFAIEGSLNRHGVTSHPGPPFASPSILPCASDSFARQEEEEEEEEEEEAEAAADCEPFELDDVAGLPESDPVFESVFDGFDSPPALDPSGELSEEPFPAPARLLASARLSVR
jgi:hypothetical protein